MLLVKIIIFLKSIETCDVFDLSISLSVIFNTFINKVEFPKLFKKFIVIHNYKNIENIFKTRFKIKIIEFFR